MSEHFEHPRSGGLRLPSRHAELLRSGAIQPHGVLLALDGPEMIVTGVSDNAERLLGVSHEALLGRPIEVLVQDADLRRACTYARETREATGRRIELAVSMGDQMRRLSGSVHRSGPFVVLELEPAASELALSFVDVYRRVRGLIERLQARSRVVDMCALAAEEIRALTGFDRVMIYRFDDDWQGECLGDSRADDMPPTLGGLCPLVAASAGAWTDCLRNGVWHIPDASSPPSALISSPGPSAGRPLDLSFSSLRNASPLQLAYLCEMGVRACMCVGILVQGKVWGLITCLHGTPKLVSYELRASCELLGQALSWQIAAAEQASRYEQASRARALDARLIERISGRARYRDGLLEDAEALLAVVNASGAAVVGDGECDVVGETPPAEDVARILAWVTRAMTGEVFSTRCLAALQPVARAYASVASGVLAIRIPESPASFVLWLRPSLRSAKDGWEPPDDRSAPWQSWELEVASELREAIVGSLSRRSDDLAQANAQLRAASLLKDELLATLSHELRTPLNAIIGWAHLLRSGGLPEERLAYAVNVILRNARVQTRLVDDLLDTSRIIRGTLRLDARSVDLVEVIEATVGSLATAAEAKSLVVRSMLDSAVGPIMGDPARLRQVVWNLLSNAIKYTPKGGRVDVRLRRKHASVEISVMDSGVGILPDELPRVFERFQRGEADASRGGLGLGLAIVRSLVELHGGTVTVSSGGRGRGACFVVRLPLAPLGEGEPGRDGQVPYCREPAAKKAPSPAKLHILVVEDDEDSQDLLAEVLRDHGARVTAVDSGSRALAVLDRETPDIIVSDIGMPGMDGYELIRRVRQRPDDRGGQVPAIALTAYVRAQDRSRAFLAGYQAHVPKPLDVGKLLSLIVSLTGRPLRI